MMVLDVHQCGLVRDERKIAGIIRGLRSGALDPLMIHTVDKDRIYLHLCGTLRCEEADEFLAYFKYIDNIARVRNSTNYYF